MPGRTAKGPRLWLQPENVRSDGRVEPAVWVIRDGPAKRRTGFARADLAAAEQALSRYLAEKHEPRKVGSGHPDQVLTVDVLALYARDVAVGHAKPKETTSRIRRLSAWWGDPATAMKRMEDQKDHVEPMTGAVADIRTATCKSYVKGIAGRRSARMDLELLRAAINHAYAERLLDRPLPVWLPENSQPRERWLTRSEVARLVWAAWRHRRTANGRSGEADGYASRKHLARFILMAHYTGTRKQAILKASFTRQFGMGFIDIEEGLWYRRGDGVRQTKKRQPPVPLPAPLLAHLRRWQKNGQNFAIEFRGKPVDRIDKAFRELVADVGLEGTVVPHTLRHTAITWGMQRGIDPWDASGYFGISLQVLLEVYGHHHPDHLREAAERMGRPKRGQKRTEIPGTKRDFSPLSEAKKPGNRAVSFG